MRRPSLPTAISLLALFIALGGTSYAVIKLPANSVGNRQIRSNAVTASKIRNGTIGPGELSPSAAGRRGPRGADGPSGPSGVVGAPAPWQVLPFAGSWSNYASGYATGEVRKDQFGKVHLRGLVTKNAGLPVYGDVIATLPPGYRPPLIVIFPSATGGPAEMYGRVDVQPSGEVIWRAGGTSDTDFTSLDAVSFWTD